MPRPLRSLADTAQDISATDLTRRIPVRGHDEASRIATAIAQAHGGQARLSPTPEGARFEIQIPLRTATGNRGGW